MHSADQGMDNGCREFVQRGGDSRVHVGLGLSGPCAGAVEVAQPQGGQGGPGAGGRGPGGEGEGRGGGGGCPKGGVIRSLGDLGITRGGGGWWDGILLRGVSNELMGQEDKNEMCGLQCPSRKSKLQPRPFQPSEFHSGGGGGARHGVPWKLRGRGRCMKKKYIRGVSPMGGEGALGIYTSTPKLPFC